MFKFLDITIINVVDKWQSLAVSIKLTFRKYKYILYMPLLFKVRVGHGTMVSAK